MADRRFTSRENMLLAVLVILLLAVVYYLLFAEPVSARIYKNQQEQSQMIKELEFQIEQADKKDQMLQQLETQPQLETGVICPYDNMNNEMKDLDRILSSATLYDISADQPLLVDSIVRRDIDISFQTESYEQAYKIIKDIENGPYRCLVKQMDLTLDAKISVVQGRVQVTYFETAIGAERTEKLIKDNMLWGKEVWDDQWVSEMREE